MKMLIAVDFGDVDYEKEKDAFFVTVYDKKGMAHDLTLKEFLKLENGTHISFDEDYLKRDRYDDNFYDAEFFGIIDKPEIK